MHGIGGSAGSASASVVPILGVLFQVLAFAVFFAGTAILAVIDARTMRLPSRVLHPVAWSVLILLAAAAANSGSWSRLVAALASCAVLVAVFFLLYKTSGLGFGDVRLAGLLGLYLGWFGPAAVLTGLTVGALIGGVTGALLLAARRVGRHRMLPYGPFLVLGAWFALLRASL